MQFSHNNFKGKLNLPKNKYSRIWDIKDEHIIKKAVELDE